MLHWYPPDSAAEGSKKSAVPASHPSLCARFVKETALEKRSAFLPDIDMIDCAVRQDNLNFAGQPIMLQLPLVPAYALTVHKTQAALSVVRGAGVRVRLVVVLCVHARARIIRVVAGGSQHQALGAWLPRGMLCTGPTHARGLPADCTVLSYFMSYGSWWIGRA